jgi:diguanylate cyclase (GGDEF)-like protein/PAS domain S-box-containing protein
MSSPVEGPVQRILVVDDEELNLDMLSRRLRRNGFVVEVADGGRKAIQMIGQQPFDLILLDQMMPGMSGAEVLRELRATDSAKTLPIIMVTAVAESQKIAEAIGAGANDYITKPVDFPVALARIRSQLARKGAEQKLRTSEERYALAAQASRDALFDWDLVSGLVYYSPRWTEMIGLGEQDAAADADAWFSRILPGDLNAVQAAVQEIVLGNSRVLHCAYRMLHADGQVRWMACRAVATCDRDGRPSRLAGSQSDVTFEKTQDALTKLPNRLLLLARLELAFNTKSDAAQYAVLFLDLDGFKATNDTLGHLAGDALLRSIAERLRSVCEDAADIFIPRPLAARMGGDEFAILLERVEDRAAVEAFAARVQRMMKEPFSLEGHILHCAFSVGIAMARPAHGTPEDILRDADIAMYTSKRRGRGETSVFSLGLQEAAVQQLDLENDIRSALSRNELQLVYQPKVDMASGQIYGVEALLRWHHPTRGLISPSCFIPIAEETGAIVEIGRWTLREACRQARLWHGQYPAGPPLELSVNLSPREFRQQGFVESISAVLEETGFPASSLHLEITEGVLFEDMAGARAVLFALKRLGISLELDDFGSGYSSLRYLNELPFDVLKVDRYFIESLSRGQLGSAKLLQTILTMGRNLGLKVIAEGVETGLHSQKLQELGCRFGQGYFFSKPVAAEALQTLLASRAAGIALSKESLYCSISSSIEMPGLSREA